MQLASSGLRALKGGQAHVPLGGGHPSRSIHIPASAPRTAQSTTTTAQAVFGHTRNLISRFVAHLTAPSTLRTPVHVAAGSSRAFHRSAARMPTIQDRMSFTTRHILSKPLAVPFLPRPPAIPRHISQVGLGTARNFSSGRPLFQHLIENVPVYARAFNEADWELRIHEERERLRMEKQKEKRAAKQAKKAKAPLRPLAQNIIPTPASSASIKEEYDHYFPAPVAPEVTTHLLIPLEPTSTSRLPLPLNPPTTSSAHPLLPLSVIGSLHQSHGTHALRVSSLFARLDTARVFDEPGVYCEARGDPSGLCTLLEVRFEGWTLNRVRGVIGEAGTGWCVMEEVWREQDEAEAEAMDAALENMSALESLSTRSMSLADMSDVSPGWGASFGDIDPSASFVLPSLDFSASFQGSAWSPPASIGPREVRPPISDLESHNVWSQRSGMSRTSSSGSSWLEEGSDSESASSDWYELSSRPPSASTSDVRFGFSSHFSERMGRSDGPREEVF